jgi:acetolactate synthase-1/2/3 large subunit
MGQFVKDRVQLALLQARLSRLPAEKVFSGTETARKPKCFDASDLLIAYLSSIDVDFIFGVPGGAIEPLYSALARSERSGGPRAIVARHETGAAFMAHGYSRNSGKLGVCCATTGPGTTNLITGVASAYENSVPLLVITAQTALNNFGRKALQESSDTGVNTVGMFQFCTGYNTMVSHVEQFEQKLITAIMTAISNSCPVHLSVPLDILRSQLSIDKPSYDAPALLRAPHMQDETAVQEFCGQLEASSGTVFVLGEGCHEAIALILRVAFKLNARIVTTPDGKGLISSYHPLYCGVIGFGGHESARQTLLASDVDTVVAVGTCLGEFSSNGWDLHALLNRRLIHVEPLASNFTRSPMARLHVRGRLVSIFESILAFLDDKEALGAEFSEDAKVTQLRSQLGESKNGGANPPLNMEGITDGTPGWEQALVKPQWLMTYLTRLFPPSTRYLADAGNSVVWAIHYLNPFDRRILERRHEARGIARKQAESGRRTSVGGLFQAALEFSSMGWAIGASVGAALAAPRQITVCITGDGSMLMSGQEMSVAQQHRLPVVFIVLNDGALGMVKHGQMLMGAEPIGYDLPDVDFSAVAKAMGIRSFRIRCPQDLLDLSIEDIHHEHGPTLLDICIDPGEVPPMDLRAQVLGA